MHRFTATLVVVLMLLTGVACTCRADVEKQGYLDKLPPMIDREIFFGDPEIASGQISPDGKFISFRKPYKDVMNIWVKAIDEPFESARPITADTTRPVRGYTWSRDGKYILYVQDKGGDENYHAYAVDPAEKLAPGQDVPTARDLTPVEGVRAALYLMPKKTPNIIYIGLNDRDERYHDVYRLDIETGERTLIRQNDDGIAGWIFDLDGNLRLATKQTDDGGTEIFRMDGDEYVSIFICSNEENANPIRFHKDGKRFYMETNKGEDVDLSRLVLFNPETGEQEIVESDPEGEVDFAGTSFSNKTDELIATYYVGDRLRIYWKNKEFEKDYKKLKKKLPDGDVYLGNLTRDDRLALVYVTSDTDPGATYMFDREKGEVELLYRPRPDLPVEHLAPMKPIKYKSRDGLVIHGYLTVPKGVKAKNLPVIVMPHGGPWARDRWGYDPYAQFLANRGYAVLQPNFRSSTGYGKKFFNAGKRKWGDEMQDDITDGVNYLIDKGISNPDQVGIFGGSYGGYATLAGLAFTPDVYAVGVSFVGPSSLITLLKSIPPYWETMRTFFTEHMGDPENPEDIERLKRQSPLYSAEKIKAPLLVVQGANDPRVKKVESDQIVVALRDLDREVEYMVAPDEGHGFAGEENRMAFVVAMEKFIARHLGGRYQESVQEDIHKRLDEIMVDVETVELTKPSADADNAQTAPLPECDPGMIAPMKLSYSASLAMSGQDIPIDVTRDVIKAEAGGVEVLRILSTQQTPMGAASDTFDLDPASMMPIRKSAAQGQMGVTLEYSEGSIKGAMKMGAQAMPVDVKLDAPVFGDGSAMELTLSALPLDAGYKTTIRSFDFQSQEVRAYSVEVTGIETVEVPAGSFESYKLEIKPLDGEMGGGTVFISKKKPRCVVRSTYQMPARAGGGTITSELKAME